MQTRPLWVFDDSEIPDPLGYGQRAVDFFDRLRHPLSTAENQQFALPRFWRRIIKRIYGPRHPDGRRVVNRVLIMAPRGSRKTTTVSAGLGLLHLAHERVKRGQVILASGSKDQADFGLEEAKGIVETTPGLLGPLRIRGDFIEHPEDRAKLRIVSSAGDITSSGSTPSAIFLDEFQYFKDRVLLKALKTGLVKRPGTLFCITMNSGRGQLGPAWEEYSYARRVALGEVDAPHYLPILFEPDSADADPFDEELWHYVNPGLSEGWPDIHEMRVAAQEAREKPAELEEFKQLNLGFWGDSATTPFVSMSVFDEGKEPFDLVDMIGLPCWLAVDLSDFRDLTVISAIWRASDTFYLWQWTFVPEANLREREDRTSAPWQAWAKQTFVNAEGEEEPLVVASGRVVDWDHVADKIKELCRVFDVKEIAFDPALARDVQKKIAADNLPDFDFPQVPKVMMPGIMELSRAVVNRQLQWGGHPVIRFCFANTEVERTRMGDMKAFKKSSDWLSIDGTVAAAMAISRAAIGEEPKWWDQLDGWSAKKDGEAA